MDIQVLSDTHIDYLEQNKWKYIYDKSADILILCGDAGEARTQKYRDFLKHLSENFKHIIIVAGNHEFYFSEYYFIKQRIEDLCKNFGNIYFLDNKVLKLEDVFFLGTTLWYDMKENQYDIVKEKLNDFNYIDIEEKGENIRLKPEDVKNMFDRDLKWLDEQLKLIEAIDNKTSQKVVVITHHSPLRVGTSNKTYESKPNGTLGYSSELYNFIKKHSIINHWVFGHTHYPCQFSIDNTVISSNPVGYKGEKTGYKKDFIIKI